MLLLVLLLATGCSSNFLVYSASRGCVLTAPDSVCLPGSIRGLAIRALAARGIKTAYEAPRWGERETQRWEAAWISSSSRLLLPVRSLFRPKQGLQRQQQQQQVIWVSVQPPLDVDFPVYWLHSVADNQQKLDAQLRQMSPLPHQRGPHQAMEGETQQEITASGCEEAIFAVGPDSLAARAAAWTAELAEQEAEYVFG